MQLKIDEIFAEKVISADDSVRLLDEIMEEMHSKDGFHCCYNVQTAVEGGSHLIAEYDVTNRNADQGLLKETAESAKKILETETIEAVADKGYESRKDILDCVMNGIVPNVAMKYDKEERTYAIDYVENEISGEECSSTKPADIQKCIAAGVLPKCYEGTAIEVELHAQAQLSCFSLNEGGTVTCPMGCVLTKIRTRGRNSVYASKEACRQCQNRCTSSGSYKRVNFGPDTKVVPVRMYGNPRHRLNLIPEDASPNPYNHTLDRNDYMKTKKVMLRIREDAAKLKERMCLSEHPFGTVKWYGGAYYLLCKGKEKAAAELGLSFLAYNLKRAINLVGTKALVAAMWN